MDDLPIDKIIDRNTNRVRVINGNIMSDAIKTKLTGVKTNNFHSVYEDDDPTRLKEVRKRLRHTNPKLSYVIRNNKIYECRKRMTNHQIIAHSFKHCIQILVGLEKLPATSDVDALLKMSLNEFYDGKKKPSFNIDIE